MATLKETRQRIASIKSTQKITRAMKLVSSAKYARAANKLVASRQYGDALEALGGELLIDPHPWATARPERRIRLIVMTSDRGLCGSLNANLLKCAGRHLATCASQNIQADLAAWGKRAGALAAGHPHVHEAREKVIDKPDAGFAREQAEQLIAAFDSGELDACYVVYAKFRNAISQEPILARVLPFAGAEASPGGNRILEPDAQAVCDALGRRLLANRLFRYALESAASEHAARMTAMDNATNNADKVIKDLTLEYNRARQAAITKELIEITSGADALS